MNKVAKRFEWSDGFTTAMQEAFEADGFLVIDGFASPNSCDKLLAQSKTLIDGFDAKAHSVAFSATGQTHAASDYFTNSATDISFFLEEEAVDEELDKTQASRNHLKLQRNSQSDAVNTQ